MTIIMRMRIMATITMITGMCMIIITITHMIVGTRTAIHMITAGTPSSRDCCQL
jgi:hypothetical protein